MGSRKVIEVPVKKTSTTSEMDDNEAATVARQNQLNEQQAQGTKSPVHGADPHNETTVSEISADITIDSVKDHTMSQQQLDSTMTSTTSKSSITAVKTTTTIAEEPEPSEPATAETNGESEDQAVNGVSESLESTALSDQADQTTLEIIPEHKNEPSEVGDETLILTDETVVHEKTLEIHDNE